MTAVVAIGGGHGLSRSLEAIRTYADSITAVVSTADDGGSSGKLRASLQMPAPGDLRRCLTTMATDRSLAAALEHRFADDDGDVSGHTPGNVLLAALHAQGHDLAAAARIMSSWLGIDPSVRVLPATTEPVDIVALTDDGVLRGQVVVELAASLRELRIDPPDPVVPLDVRDAIHEADQVVIGPGSLYTSVLTPVVVPAISAALAATSAPLVYVCNLRADEAGVHGFDVAAHVAVLRDHGIVPDVVVAQDRALAIGDLRDVVIHVGDFDRPHGLAHDPELLGRALASYAGAAHRRDRSDRL